MLELWICIAVVILTAPLLQYLLMHRSTESCKEQIGLNSACCLFEMAIYCIFTVPLKGNRCNVAKFILHFKFQATKNPVQSKFRNPQLHLKDAF